MGALSLLLAIPTVPGRGELCRFPTSPGRPATSLVPLKNAGSKLAVIRPRRGATVPHSSSGCPCPTPENERSDVSESWRSLARIVGLGVVFAAFALLGGRRGAGVLAAPVTSTQFQSLESSTQDDSGDKQDQVWKTIMEVYGLEERLDKFFAKVAEREEVYRAAFGVDEVVKDVEKIRMQRNVDEAKVYEMVEQGKQRLRIEARRMQGKIILETSSYLAKLRKEDEALMKELDKAMEDYPGLREAFETPRGETSDEMEAQIQLFYSRTEELRKKMIDVKAELLGSEYEGWHRAWREIPAYASLFNAELEQLVTKYEQSGPEFKAPEPLESRLASDLTKTGSKLFEENVLPIAMNVREKQNEVVRENKIESEVDEMLRNHIQFAREEQTRMLRSIKEKLGSPELHAAFSEKLPSTETMLGWRKWCSIKQNELKQHLLDNPKLGRQYFKGKQEKLVLARDRILENTWYHQKVHRWEMSTEAALYALENNLVHHVRIRHDFRVFFLSLKGESQEYAVDIQDIDDLLEDEGGFDAFYHQLEQNKVPTVVEKMWIPFSEWSVLQFVKIPFLLVWDVSEHLWNIEIVRAGREMYVDVLMGVVQDVYIRFLRAPVGKLPHQVRVFLTLELPKGAEFADPTPFMKWEQAAQEKFDTGDISLPWWLDLPIRGYLVGAPLLLVGTYVARVVWFLVGPRPLPKTQYRKAMELAQKVYKKMTPLLKQVTTNPIKRVFDKMKRIRKPEVPLKDFVGIESFKEEVDEVVSFLRNPSAYKKLGARPPRGVLIVGETGTGKTTLARAIASEARVPVVELQSFDIQGGGQWVGQKAANVRELFKTARQYAPIILFMDDFHDFVGKRGDHADMNSQELESLINQFLVELDGFETQEGVVVLATTGFPERIDEALRRPGRMDRTITLLTPNRAQREQMLRLIARDTMFPYVRDWVNWAELAEKTEGLPYVELQPLPVQLQQAATHWKNKDDEELHTYRFLLDIYNRVVPRWIRNIPLVWSWDQKLIDFLGIRVTKEDMENAVRYVDIFGRSKPGIELHDPDYLWTSETKYPHAIWAAARGLVALLLPNFDVVDLLWLDETSWEGIAWTRLTRKTEEGYLETNTLTRSYLEKKLVVCYGPHVAESMLLSNFDRTDLPKPQLDEAEQIAGSMVLDYGWGLDDCPMVYRNKGEGPMNMGYQERRVFGEKVRMILRLAEDRAAKILSQNKEILEIFIEQLVERQYITQEMMESILREKGAIYEQEPFILKETNSSPQSANGTGRSSNLSVASLS